MTSMSDEAERSHWTAGDGHEGPLTRAVNDQGRQRATEHRSRIHTSSVGEQRGTSHEGLVSEDNVSESPIPDLGPEWIARTLISQLQKLACLPRKVACSQRLGQCSLGLACQRCGFLGRGRELNHSSRDTTVNHEHPMVGDSMEHDSAVKKGHILFG